MITEEVFEAISNIDNENVRDYCLDYAVYVNKNMGSIFDIEVKELIQAGSESSPFVALILKLNVRENVRFIYGDYDEDDLSGLTSDYVMKIYPNVKHYNEKHFNRDLVETVRRGLSDSVKKLEKSTYLDTFNIDCSLEIDGVSFRHSFVKGDIRV